MTIERPENERKRKYEFIYRPAKRHYRASVVRVLGLIHPDPVVAATPHTARNRRQLSSRQRQATLQSSCG